MSTVEYQAAQDALLLFCNAIAPLPLDVMLERIDRALAAGPIIHPSLYIQGCDRLEAFRAVVSAASRLQKRHAELRRLVATDGKMPTKNSERHAASEATAIMEPARPQSVPSTDSVDIPSNGSSGLRASAPTADGEAAANDGAAATSAEVTNG